MTDDRDLTDNQFLAPELVMTEMAEVGARRAVGRGPAEVLVLSMIAGGFITVGALFSTLIATGTTNEGTQRLLEGFGFSVGFFAVVMTGTLLFTEVNVEMPATLLSGDPRSIAGRVARLWILAAVGNFVGAYLTGLAITAAQDYSSDVDALLSEIVDAKMRYREIGGTEGWSRAVLSGVLGNWLVGMAAFLAVMGRTIIGRYIPVLLMVSAFVAAGFLHSPAKHGVLLSRPTRRPRPWLGPRIRVEHRPCRSRQHRRRVLPRRPAVLGTQQPQLSEAMIL